jgi:hypothetical protein
MRRTVIALVLAALVLPLTIGAQAPVSVNQVGGQDVQSLQVTPILLTALTNTAQTVRSSGGGFESFSCFNPNSSVSYVQVFDISGSVTVGTSTPKLSYGIGANASWGMTDLAMVFANAIKVAATTGATNGTAPTNALVCNFGYW